MASRFAGFPPATLKFLSELAANNNRDWFEANRARYEEDVKAPMHSLIAVLNGEFLRIAPDYATEPKRAMFRIHRDVRFSKNKDPYKTNVAAAFWRQDLPKSVSAAFYVHLDQQELFVGGGCYMPPPEQLRLLRAHVAAHHERFAGIVEDKKRKKLLGGLYGEPAARVPKGFAPDHPAAGYLRHKMYIYAVTLAPGEASSPKLAAQVTKVFASMVPFIEFLNEAMEGQAKAAKVNFLL
jgi:uncharacterized protein (TIGR02453 family)